LERTAIERKRRDIVPHSARHSLATYLLDNGVPLKHIQNLLGHGHLKVTQKYTQLLENTMREIGRKVSETRERHQAETDNIIEF